MDVKSSVFSGFAPVCAVVLAAVVLSSCEQQPPSIEPEVEHCAITAGRATQTYGDITIVREHHWTLENVRGVQLRFEYPPDYEEFRFGNIQCTYEFSLATRADPHRVVYAQSVYFKGRYLSENELRFLNTSPFRPQPIFKVIP